MFRPIITGRVVATAVELEEAVPVSEPEELSFLYERADGYRIVASNGAFGGTTTQGDFRIDFYVETPEVPTMVRHKIVDRTLGEIIERLPTEARIVRQLQFGVLMSRDQARNLAEWINRKLAESETASSENK